MITLFIHLIHNITKNNKMKKTINNSKGIVGLLLCLLLLSFAGNAQVAGTHFAVGLANVTSTSTTIEMDLQLTVDGSVNSRLLGFSAGINYNTAIVNGGTLTFEYIGGRSQALSAFLPNTLNSANTPGHLRIAASSLSSALILTKLGCSNTNLSGFLTYAVTLCP